MRLAAVRPVRTGLQQGLRQRPHKAEGRPVSIATYTRRLAADVVMFVWATGVFSWLAIKEVAKTNLTRK
ncbi:hypothetical protein [Curvibacter phage PCA1]|nr:hypothetical protein [Curvibacter phage PCA1]